MFFVQMKRYIGLIFFICLGYIFFVLFVRSSSMIDVKSNSSEIMKLTVNKNVNDTKNLGKKQTATALFVNLFKQATSILKPSNPLAIVKNPSNYSILVLGPSNETSASNQSNITIPDGVTCSDNASRFGSNQKVITYTIYGDHPSYWQGLPEIMIQAKILYPSWFVRVYTDKPGIEILQSLSQKFNFLQICDVNNLPPPQVSLKEYPSMMWRYFPLGDPQIDIVIFRDSDSELLVRDHDAVEEWLERTTKSLHMMRDHPYHGTEILGGMWGARITSANREKWKEMRDTLFTRSHKSTKEKQLDQSLLRTVVWPAFKNDSIAHDSYLCRSYPGSVPFPSQRTKAAFVGSQYFSYYGYGKLNECPAECRPILHQDWIYC